MNEVAKAVLTAPIATLFIVAGILFLFIAVVGNISGKIEPGNKARIASAVFGLVFVGLGLTMHWLQKTPGVPESSVVSPLQSKSGQVSNVPQQPATSAAGIPKQESIAGRQPTDKKETLDSPIHTTFPGVVANITQFKKTGELVMLELVARNSSSRSSSVCFHPFMIQLIDASTGESWQPQHLTGRPCTALDANKSTRMWMKFEISEPEKRTFSLSSSVFKGTLDNLVLAESL
jgi:hypothetical protein